VCSAQPTPNDKDLDPPPPKDDDPEGLKLIGSPDVLERASKLLHPLMTLAPNNIDVWIAVYDVAIRRSEHFILLSNLVIGLITLHRKTTTGCWSSEPRCRLKLGGSTPPCPSRGY